MWSGAPHGQKPFPTRASLTLCIKQSLRPRPCPEQFRKSDALSMEEAAHSVSKLLDAPRDLKHLDQRLSDALHAWGLLTASLKEKVQGSAGTSPQPQQPTEGPQRPDQAQPGDQTAGEREAAGHATEGHEGAGAEGGSMQTVLWQALSEAAYLLAMDLLLSPSPGHHTAADALLSLLGLRWRLSRAVWQACGDGGGTSATSVSAGEEATPSQVVAAALQQPASAGQQQQAPGDKKERSTAVPGSWEPLVFGRRHAVATTGPVTKGGPSADTAAGEAAAGLKDGSAAAERRAAAGRGAEVAAGTRLGQVQSLLPSATLEALSEAFCPQAPFWADHDYHSPGTPFFSYAFSLQDVGGAAGGGGGNRGPSNVVELACLQLRQALASLLPSSAASSPTPPGGATIPTTDTSPTGLHGTGVSHPHCASLQQLAQLVQQATHVEWWAHTRAPGAAHQLHFDVDETRLGKGPEEYALAHPLVSSVLFLTDSGGPTVVLDQVPGQVGLAERAWAAFPERGSLLCFPSNRLHGVLPGPLPPDLSRVHHPAAGDGGSGGGSGDSSSGDEGSGQESSSEETGSSGSTSSGSSTSGSGCGCQEEQQREQQEQGEQWVNGAGWRTTLIIAWWGPGALHLAPEEGGKWAELNQPCGDAPGSAAPAPQLRPQMRAPRVQPQASISAAAAAQEELGSPPALPEQDSGPPAKRQHLSSVPAPGSRVPAWAQHMHALIGRVLAQQQAGSAVQAPAAGLLSEGEGAAVVPSSMQGAAPQSSAASAAVSVPPRLHPAWEEVVPPAEEVAQSGGSGSRPGLASVAQLPEHLRQAVQQALPNLRLFIPAPQFFNDMYPVTPPVP